MIRYLFIFLCIFTIFTLIGCQGQKTETVTTPVQGTEGVQKGDLALNFSLSDMTGKTVELKSLRGKKAVHIVFWSGG